MEENHGQINNCHSRSHPSLNLTQSGVLPPIQFTPWASSSLKSRKNLVLPIPKMEKQTKHKNRMLRFIPKALSFQNPAFSPPRDKEVAATRHGGRGFSGPIVSIIPKEPWRRNKSVMVDTPQEPTSPKVSCLGQIKQRQKKKKKKMMINKEKDGKRSRVPSMERVLPVGTKRGAAEEKAPALGQMRRFASSRSSLSNFDWAAQVVSEDSDRGSSYPSVEERDREEVRIPFSAPLAFGFEEMRLQPKKEINLWKRRTMAPPRPLTLDS